MIHSLHYKLTHAARSIEKWTSDVQNPSRIAMLNNKLFFTKFFRKFHNSLEVLKHDSVVTSYNPLTQQCVFPWCYMVKIRQKITFIAHYHCVQVKRLFFILIKHKNNDMYTIFLSRHSIGDIPSALWCHIFKSSLLLCPVQFHFIP